MKKMVHLSFFAATVFSFTGIAKADENKGITFSFGTGLESLTDPDLTFVDAGIDGVLSTPDDDVVETSLDAKNAIAFHGGIGYDFGNVRLELSASYSRHKSNNLQIKSVNAVAVTTLTPTDLQDFADFALEDADIDPANVTVAGNTVSLKSGSIAKIRNVAATVDVYYDIPTGGKISPYIGAGVGVGGQHIKFFGTDEGFTKLTWKLSAGASYAISDKVSISADYTYRQTGKGKLIGADPTFETRVGKTKTSNLGVSVRFKF
jgi:opacity protein-like surface antigen